MALYVTAWWLLYVQAGMHAASLLFVQSAIRIASSSIGPEGTSSTSTHLASQGWPLKQPLQASCHGLQNGTLQDMQQHGRLQCSCHKSSSATDSAPAHADTCPYRLDYLT